MKINVFSHKRFIGIQGIDVQPKGMGNIESINKDNFKITIEAFNLLHEIKRGNNDIGDIDCFKHGDDIIFGWFGGAFGLFPVDDIETSNEYDFSLLKDFICDDIKIPVEFIEACSS
jgi:hypothetical protein